jgi:hypothetical protein
MAYDTGSASTPTQVLDALRVFAVANGWTQNRWQASGSGYELCLSKGSLYANLRSIVNETVGFYALSRTGIVLNGSAGFDSGQAWNNQPGKCANTSNAALLCGAIEFTSSNTYHLFSASSPDLIMLVVEISPGTFTWIHFGNVIKCGSWNGGMIFGGRVWGDASVSGGVIYSDSVSPASGFGGDGRSSSYIHAEVDGSLAWRNITGNTGPSPTGYKGYGNFSEIQSIGAAHLGFAGEWTVATPNQLNGITPMIPAYVFAARPSNYRSPLGYIPHICYMRIDNYAPGETFSLGSEQWMAFPTISKGGASGMDGFAVRKNG